VYVFTYIYLYTYDICIHMIYLSGSHSSESRQEYLSLYMYMCLHTHMYLYIYVKGTSWYSAESCQEYFNICISVYRVAGIYIYYSYSRLILSCNVKSWAYKSMYFSIYTCIYIHDIHIRLILSWILSRIFWARTRHKVAPLAPPLTSTVCCSVLQCVAACCSEYLQKILSSYKAQSGSAGPASNIYGVLQCVAVCCSVLQWIFAEYLELIQGTKWLCWPCF